MKGLIFSALFLFGLNLEAATRYDAYLGNVVGSPRVIGVGGAYRSEAEGIEGAMFNPAGLSWMETWWDVDLNYGFYNQEFANQADFVDTSTKDYSFFHFGFAFKFPKYKDLAVGLSIYTPYSFSLSGQAISSLGTSEAVNYDFTYAVGAIPVSLRINDDITVGATLRGNSATMTFSSYSEGTSNEESEATASGIGFDLGVIYQYDQNQRYSLTYYFGEQMNFKEGGNIDVIGFDPYRAADRPHRLYVGSSYRWTSRIRSYFDFGFISSTADTLVPGSAMSPNVATIESGQSISIAYHLGAEYLILPGQLEGRLGHYYQAPRSNLDPHRFHVTGGLDYFFWYLRLGIAADWAQDYYYFTLGVSPSFSHKSRVERQSF